MMFLHAPSRFRPIPCRSASLHSAGFSLLEVLVAIVVLSFGVLGVVGLQAASLQANKQARYQSAAVRLGLELGDLMRGNKDIALVNTTDPTVNPYVTDFPARVPTSTTDCSVGVAACNTTTLAQFQIADWVNRVPLDLPGARVVVCFDQTPYDASGMPQWACTQPSATATATPGLAVVKMGWTRQSTNTSATGTAALDRTTDALNHPAIILPLNPGNPG